MDRQKVISIFSCLKSYFKMPQKYQQSMPAVPQAVWQNPLYFIGFGLGSGAMPFAPGTFGTLMAIPFYVLLSSLGLYAYFIFAVCFCVASAYLCDYLSRQLDVHDHPGMCIDEFAGFFVTMIAAPSGWPWIVLGFLLFRLFDIWKPWPIHYLDEKIHGGFGMVIDDVVAGVFALVVMQVVVRVA